MSKINYADLMLLYAVQHNKGSECTFFHHSDDFLPFYFVATQHVQKQCKMVFSDMLHTGNQVNISKSRESRSSNGKGINQHL